ncbi:hypothetical protein XENTR_v10023151 [Xenopus tropicalis]|nr:hypothetical protein XENTR_v10023151 [Xenopus tropicalis]
MITQIRGLWKIVIIAILCNIRSYHGHVSKSAQDPHPHSDAWWGQLHAPLRLLFMSWNWGSSHGGRNDESLQSFCHKTFTICRELKMKRNLTFQPDSDPKQWLHQRPRP